MVQALLTDLDGVIRRWDPAIEQRAEQATGLPAGALRQAAFAPDLLHGAITGQITDELWRTQVAERLQTLFPTVDAAQAVALWSASAGAVDGAVLELVRACRQKVPVILVTNATSRLPQDLQRLGLSEEFDHIINSSVVGYCKPHPAIFQTALATVGVAAPDAVFVDDGAGNVAAASQLGLIGHFYQDLDGLKAALRHHQLL